MTLRTGDRITIHSGRVAIDGTVATICHVDDLPVLPGNAAKEVRDAIQSGGHFVHVATLEYEFMGATLAVLVFEDHRGAWWDVKGHAIMIEPRTAENELLKKQQAKEGPFLKWRRPIDWSKF